MSCDVIGHVTSLDQSEPSIQLTCRAPGGETALDQSNAYPKSARLSDNMVFSRGALWRQEAHDQSELSISNFDQSGAYPKSAHFLSFKNTHILLRGVQEVCSGLPPIDQGLDAFWAVMAKWTTSAGQYLFTTLTKLTKLYIGIVDSERAFSVVNKLTTELPVKTTAYRLSVTIHYNGRHSHLIL